MSLTTVFEISAQGMTAQRERLEAQAANLANANTTRTGDGRPYKRRDVVLEAVPVADRTSPFGIELSSWSDQEQPAPQGVRALTFIDSNGTGTRHYQPGHPDADAEGYVTMPDVDPLEETVNILSSARAFQANATAFNSAKEMIRASIQLGTV